MKRELTGSVVVITGATSGAGRATAHAFARRGARMVLAARSESALEAVVRECRELGATAIAAPTDLGDAASVDDLRRRAVEIFGRIDTWVQMTAVLIAGDLPSLPADEMERVVRTNVLGAALSSRAALTQFEAQGAGVLITTSSILAVTPNPVVPLYVMSKFAVRGLTTALHSRYARRGGIRVCEVAPGPLDTPMFRTAANHSGFELRAVPPACAPERAAAAVVRCARRPGDASSSAERAAS